MSDHDLNSDSEDSLPLPSLRRLHPSDDEDDVTQPPEESDGQGGAQLYDYYDDNNDDEDVDDDVECFGEEENGGLGFREVEVVGGGVELREEGVAVEGEKKKTEEVFVVPTAGAFYMHDDRVRLRRGRGRARPMFGARKLWAPKEEQAWVHDRFDEMNLQDGYHGNGKRSRGRFGGGGKNRGAGQGFVRATHTDNSNNDKSIRTVRGRGPIHYETRDKSIRENLPTKQKQAPAKHQRPTPNYGLRRLLSPSRNSQSEPGLPWKHTFSCLSHASQPFYPPNLYSQPVTSPKKDPRAGNASKADRYSVLDGTSPTTHSSSVTRGQMLFDTIVHDKFCADDAIQLVLGKSLVDSHMQSSKLSSSTDSVQFSSSIVQGRGSGNVVPPSNQLTTSYNHFLNASAPSQSLNIFHRSFQPLTEHEAIALTQKSVQHFGSGNHLSSPSLPSLSLSEVRESDSPLSSSKSKSSLVGKGKFSNQGTASGPILCGNAQVIGGNGAIGVSHGDQNFPHTPALLPVMQFGRQEAGCLGIPTIGMALPGYVAQPQLGLGSSEMTWLSMLAGAAGSLGPSYCPPYIAPDSSYSAMPAGSKSSAAFSREASSSMQSNAGKSPEISEIVNDKVGQRQSKPRRRYSEMSFDQ